MQSIKVAKIEDLQVIHDLAHIIWPVAYGKILSEAQLEYMLDKMYSIGSLKEQLLVSKHEFIIIENDSTPVGFASFSPKVTNNKVFKLHKIYVLPSEQGKGTGKILLAYIINKVKSTGASIVELNVNRQNTARYFYEKQGFIISGETDIDIGNGYFMNDYIMELSIH